MTYQEQVKKIYGERSINVLLAAVDHGHVEVKHALDMSFRPQATGEWLLGEVFYFQGWVMAW